MNDEGQRRIMTTAPQPGGGQEPLQRASSTDEGNAKMTAYAPGLTENLEPQIDGKWSARKSLIFIVATSFLLWAALIAAMIVLL